MPDEAAQTPLERYVEPRRAEWRKRITWWGIRRSSARHLRAAVGDGYVEALARVWQEVPNPPIRHVLVAPRRQPGA